MTDIGVTLNFSEAIDELETTIKYQVGSGAEGTFNFTTSAPGSGDCIKNPPTGYVCTYTPTAGENGLFKVKVSAYKDLSGNAGAPGSYNTGGIVVDTTPLAAPTIALKTPSSSPGNLNMPVFTVTVPEDGLRVALFEGGCDDNWGSTSNVSDNSPPLTIDLSPVALSEGTYTYQARYTKDKYFVSPCSAAITYVYDGTPPAAPANLAVTRSAGQVTLTWDDPKDRSIVKYQIKQRTAFGAFPAAWTDIPRSDATTTSYTVTGLDDNEEYIFKLVASDAANGQGAEALTGTSLPKVVSMRLDSLPHYPNHYYGRDESIVVAVRFDLPVAVSGSSDATPTFPQLKLGGITVKPSGAADPVADYYWQEGNTVYFRWKVLAGYATPGAERFPPGGAVSIPANPIVLNGGTIQHAETGVDADLSFGGWSESDRFSHNYQAVDGSQTNVVATVNSVAMGTTGPYYYFDPIRIDVTFDVPTSGDVLKVRGLPYINVRVGANIHKFAFWGINGNVVSFGHEVEDWHSEYDPDGPSMNTGEIVMFHSGQNDEIYVERSVSITGLDVRDPQRKKKVTVTRTLRLAVDPRHPGMADQGVRHPVDGLHGGLRDGKKFKPSSAVPAPRNLTATAGDGLVRLSWDPYDGKHVEGWFVWWEGAPKWKWFDHDRTSVVVKGLTNGQEYKFRVRAEYYGSGGVVSKEVTATPQAGLSFPNRAPVWAEGRPTEGDVSIAEFLAGSDKIVLARLAFVDPEGEPLTYEIIEPPPGNAFAGIRSAFSVRIEDKGAVKPSVLDQTHQRTHEFLNRVMGLGGFQLCVKATDPHGLSASHCLFMPPAAVTTPSIFVGQAKGHVTRVARPQAATGDVTFAIQRNMTYHLPGASSSPVTHNRDPFTLGLSINPSTGLLSYDGKLVVTRPTWVEYGLYHQFRSGLHLPNEVELQVKITGNGLPAAGVIEKVRIKIWAWLE